MTCPVNEVQTQPKSLTRASASYLRLKTRNSSTNSLAEALSKSLSLDERIMFLGKSFSADFDDLEAPLLDEVDEGNMSDTGEPKMNGLLDTGLPPPHLSVLDQGCIWTTLGTGPRVEQIVSRTKALCAEHMAVWMDTAEEIADCS